MAEENVVVPEETKETAVVKPSETEVKETDNKVIVEKAVQDEVSNIARSMGWQDESKYTPKDGKDFVGAKEYITTTENIKDTQGKTIENMRTEIGGLKDAINSLYKYQTAKVKSEVDQKMKVLEVQKTKAIEGADVDAVKVVEEEMSDMLKVLEIGDSGKVEDKLVSSESKVFSDWIEKNPWYDDKSPEFNRDLFAMAQGIANGYPKESPMADVLAVIDTRIKPHIESKKETVKTTTETPVNALVGEGDSPPGGKKTFSFNDLPAEAQEVYKTMEKTINDFDGKKYIEELQETGVLE